MGAFSKAYCKQQIDKWVAASEKLMLSQEYMADGIRLTRANLKEVQSLIEFWEEKYNKAEGEENGSKSGFITMIPMG